MKTHDFNEKLREGQEGENALDVYFRRWYNIKSATHAEQRLGIDRHFYSKNKGKHTRVEYKTDTVAISSGNAFIETVSQDTNIKGGWAFTSKAEILVYYVPVPLKPTIYIVRFSKLRRYLMSWKKQYMIKLAHNKDYSTYGIPVPLSELEKVSDSKRIISTKTNTKSVQEQAGERKTPVSNTGSESKKPNTL